MVRASRSFGLFFMGFVILFSGLEGEIRTYEIKRGDLSVKVTNFGARIVSVVLPDKNGNLGDVVLGYDTITQYMNDSAYLGAIVGRVANRIAGARFTLNGTLYKLDCNEGSNTLHGGRRGFSQVVWKVKSHRQSGSSPSVSMQYHSRDGEQGFPGDLRVTVTYAIPEPYRLTVDMKATAVNKPTPVNLAQHSYWNLAGHNSGNILSHELQLFASHTTPVGQHLIPTGEIASVKRTPYDFLEPHPINAQISSLPAGSKGYDINYAVDGYRAKRTRPVAAVYSPRSGRRMELSSDAPGVQLYTANYLHDVKGKGGFLYQNHAGLCLETQGFPDSVNHPHFPSQIVFPGGTYKHHMVYAFSVDGGGGLGTPKCRKRSA